MTVGERSEVSEKRVFQTVTADPTLLDKLTPGERVVFQRRVDLETGRRLSRWGAIMQVYHEHEGIGLSKVITLHDRALRTLREVIVLGESC